MSTASPGSDEQLSIKGDLATTTVPDLLRTFLQSRETGRLVCSNGVVTKQVFLQDGRVVFATSTDPDERLGENLLVRGKITARHYVEASRLIRPGRRLGAILVELRALDSDDLIASVAQQVKDILLELCDWSQGDYELLVGEIDRSDVVPLGASTENLILQGIRRTKGWSRVTRGIGGIDAVPVPSAGGDLLYKLELTEEEQEVLSRVNGKSSIEQICQVSYLSNFETCRILWALQLVGAIRRGGAADAAAAGEGLRVQEQEFDLEAIVEQFNQMFGKVYEFLAGRLGGEVDAFMDAAMDEVSRQYGALFEGVDLKNYGRADFEQMLTNVAGLPPDQRRELIVTGLNELTFVLQLSVRTRSGAEDEAVVSGIIQEGFRKLAGR